MTLQNSTGTGTHGTGSSSQIIERGLVQCDSTKLRGQRAAHKALDGTQTATVHFNGNHQTHSPRTALHMRTQSSSGPQNLPPLVGLLRAQSRHSLIQRKFVLRHIAFLFIQRQHDAQRAIHQTKHKNHVCQQTCALGTSFWVLVISRHNNTNALRSRTRP